VAERILAETSKVLFGQRYMMERLLIALFSGGHILLEGVPGLAKTLAIKTWRRRFRQNFSEFNLPQTFCPLT